MTEAELQRAVLELCGQLDPRIRAVHLHDSRRATHDTRGLPDLFLIGAHRCCWRELKPAGGRPRGPQSQWLYWLRQVGHDAGVWRPADWHSGRIAAELEGLNLPPGPEAAASVGSDPDPERAFFRVLYAPRHNAEKGAAEPRGAAPGAVGPGGARQSRGSGEQPRGLRADWPPGTLVPSGDGKPVVVGGHDLDGAAPLGWVGEDVQFTL